MNKKLKINKTVLKIFLLVFPFFPMRGLTFLGMRYFSYAYEVLMGLIVIVLALRALGTGLRGKKRMIPILFCMLGLTFIIYLSTYLNDGNFIQATHRILEMWGAFFIMDYGFGKSRNSFLRGMCIVLSFIAILNLIGIIAFYSRGSLRAAGDFWLFGQRNAMRNFLLPCVAFNLLYDECLGIRISRRSVLMTLISCISVIVAGSATSTVVILLMAVLFYVHRRWGFNKISLKVFIIVFLILQTVLVSMRAIDVFSFFIVKILQRDVTLTGRIAIWDSALRGIQAHPYLGTGIQLLEDSELTTRSGTLFSHAHNVLLDTCYKTGYIGLAFLIALFIFSVSGLKKSNGSVSYIAGVLLGLFLITGLVGDIWSFGCFVALFFASHADEPEPVFLPSANEFRWRELRFKAF